MELLQETRDAAKRIQPYIRRTRVVPSAMLGIDAAVTLKCEHEQRTGSFKIRGAMNALLLLTNEERERGVVTASTGNHGRAVAEAADALAITATVFAPSNASPEKIEAIQRIGTKVLRYGDDCLEAERAARLHGERLGARYISPYNDRAVIAGQGSLAVELHEQVEGLDAVVVSLGGGGLASGVAGYLKSISPTIRVIGVSPKRSAVLHHSIAAGYRVDLPSEATLSDATAGGLEEGAITLPICSALLDETVLVCEDEIEAGMRMVHREHGARVEGAAGVAIAGAYAARECLIGATVAIVLCGGNITNTLHAQVMAGGAQDGSRTPVDRPPAT